MSGTGTTSTDGNGTCAQPGRPSIQATSGRANAGTSLHGTPADVSSGPPSEATLVPFQYIEEHLANEVSLPLLVRLVQLSPYHFCRAFKQSFGVPPHRYLTDHRIERAEDLLAGRKLSVTEIALDVGFSDSFTAAFRKCTGETPTDCRRSLASQTFAFSFREYCEAGGPADRKPRGSGSS
jgi:AraC-like DNA-binding protein